MPGHGGPSGLTSQPLRPGSARPDFPLMPRTVLPAVRRIALVASATLIVLAAAPAAAADARASRFYEDALARYEKQDLAGAIIQLKNALQIDRNMLPVHVLMGKALLQNGEAVAAEVALTEALRLGVNRAEVVMPLAQAFVA